MRSKTRKNRISKTQKYSCLIEYLKDVWNKNGLPKDRTGVK